MTAASRPAATEGPAAPAATGEDLEALYRSWEILGLVGETVAALPPAWLQILNVARNIMIGASLPGVDIPESLANLAAPPRPTVQTVISTRRKRRIVYSPTDDTALQPLHNIMDFAQITLPDLMLRSLSPGMFDYRLISGGINGLYSVDLPSAVQEYDEIVEERILVDPPRRKKRQKVYALLDVSNSMREHNKIIFAKALMLSYLITASRERANIYFRTFGNTIHERTDVTGGETFAPLARRVLRVTPDGATDIKGALDVAISDIREIDQLNSYERMSETPQTEILLISDCESYSVPYIPRGMKLHTVHLTGGWMMTAYRDGFERIKAESASFHEISTTAFTLPDTSRERWLLAQDGVSLERPALDARTLVEHGETPVSKETLIQLYERMASRGERRRAVRAKLRALRLTRSTDFAWLFELLAKLWRLVARREAPLSTRLEHAPSHPRVATQFRHRS